MSKLAVVHLVRAANGISPYKAFLNSYLANPGGTEHDLVILLKGFGSELATREYLDLSQQIKHRIVHVPDKGLDLTAYKAAVAKLPDYDYFCFLNSFSVLKDTLWLDKMFSYACRADVGIVGATGSYQSALTDVKTELFDDRDIKHLPHYKRAVIFGHRLLVLCRFSIAFPPFPNYHIRSNAFVLSSRVLRAIRWPDVRTKFEAYKLESGKHSLTHQVLQTGKRAIVVGRDGSGYDKEQWIFSNTFWQRNQANVLVEDNQTRQYAQGVAETRKRLSLHAWRKDLTTIEDLEAHAS
jgi:hypothetical protein